MKPYEKLAPLYDKGEWGKYSLIYMELIDNVCNRYSLKPSSILDIACGTGSLVGELSCRGFKTMGSDISPEMIKIAQNNHPRIPFIVADMTRLNLNDTFDMVVCPFDSLNYLLTDKEIISTFSNVFRHLSNNGLFIFDFVTANLYGKKHHGVINRNIEGVSFRQILKYDPEKKLASTVFVFDGDEREEHLQKAYTENEIAEKLVAWKFRILNAAKNIKLINADDLSERIFIVAQK